MSGGLYRRDGDSNSERFMNLRIYPCKRRVGQPCLIIQLPRSTACASHQSPPSLALLNRIIVL